MEKQFWNNRYKEHISVYSEKTNVFFKEFIDKHKPGTILLPAEGEGRNTLYAASKGWQVDAFDFSEVAKEKALKKAQTQGLKINYRTLDIASYKVGKKYHAVALIYVHLPEALRQTFHGEILNSLMPGGYLVFEGFAKEQIHLDSGGPQNPALLYDAPIHLQRFSVSSFALLWAKRN